MFPITITLHDAQQLNAVMQTLGATAAAPAPKAAKTETAKTRPSPRAHRRAAGRCGRHRRPGEVNRETPAVRRLPVPSLLPGRRWAVRGKSTDKPEPQRSTAADAGASSAVDYATLQTAVLAL